MKPARVSFATFNNEAWQEGVLLTLIDGSAFDFGDYDSLRLQVKYSEDHPLPLLDLTLGDGLAVETDGGLGIDASVDDMTALLGTYPYDVVGTTDDVPVVIMFGTVTVAQGKTY